MLLWHYVHFAYVADKPVDLVRDRLPLYDLLQPFYEAGEYGVWVFWCISGFIFFWKYRDAIADRSMHGWTFLVYRLSRLYPLHFVTLLIVALLQPIYFRQHGYFFVYQANDWRTSCCRFSWQAIGSSSEPTVSTGRYGRSRSRFWSTSSFS